MCRSVTKWLLSSRDLKVGAESMSHEIIWRHSLAEVAASRKAPRNEEFHKGVVVAAVQCIRRGSDRR